jgi:lipid II:glycine glycyltransferase (peptidoglycan interpeptide bridge formation enzyme)
LYAKEAVDLLLETSARQGYKAYGREYYEGMINFLAIQNTGQLNLHIYKAVYNNKLLASAIMLDFSAKSSLNGHLGGSASGGGTRTFLFGGSSEENKNIMAPYLLHWRAMVDAKVAGLTQYDFWGIETSSGEVPGFVRFKLGFATPSTTSSGPSGQQSSGSLSGIKEYSGAYDIVISPVGYKLYKILRKIKRFL